MSSTIKDLRTRRDAKADAFNETSDRIEQLEAQIAQQASEREKIKNELRDARRELAATEARAVLGPSAELARALARQQATVARLDNALRELPETDDEKALADLCKLADQLERDYQRLDDELGRAVLADAEEVLRETERDIKELEEQLARLKMELAEHRESIPDLLAEWPELHEAAQRAYAPKPAAPVPSRPDPTRQIMAAFVRYADALSEHAGDASQVVNGQNIVGWMELTASEIESAFRGNASNVLRKMGKIEDLL